MSNWPAAKFPFWFLLVWIVLDSVHTVVTSNPEHMRNSVTLLSVWATLKVMARFEGAAQ